MEGAVWCGSAGNQRETYETKPAGSVDLPAPCVRDPSLLVDVVRKPKQTPSNARRENNSRNVWKHHVEDIAS